MASAATAVIINKRKLRYTGSAIAAFKEIGVDTNLHSHDNCKDKYAHADGLVNGSRKPCSHRLSAGRVWLESKHQQTPPPQPAKERHIGNYPLTTKLSSWAMKALASFAPSPEVLELVRPFAATLHDVFDNERNSSTGQHDIDAIELTYQTTLEISAAFLLAADATDDPVNLSLSLHASRAGGDDHFKPWGLFLTGLECDPPIIAQFPFYLFLCQAFTFEPKWNREDFVYSALTGVDWTKGSNKFNSRFAAFEALARSSVPTLDDATKGYDRSYWRMSLAYLSAMNGCENVREFKVPRSAAIQHNLHPDLVLMARGFDTIGSAYMCRDGAAWLDDEGLDSLIGSALPNDVMDLHTDIYTGETRNLIRLLYPPSTSIEQSMSTMSTLLSCMLCEVFRGHSRAWSKNREDGRISSTSPPYSFSRSRHRRIFETLELYITRYPQFWEWTWEIYRMAKAQITEAGLLEPLVCGLKRAITQGQLPESPSNKFFHLWYDMVEDGSAQLDKPQPLGVSEDLGPVVRKIHSLWHHELRDETKKAGWGRKFDCRSDALLGDAGEMLLATNAISDTAYKFAIAYGRLSMGLPYVAYHTIDAIIMTFGALPPV